MNEVKEVKEEVTEDVGSSGVKRHSKAKPDMVTIYDDDNGQPPVKKPVPSPEVTLLKEQLLKTEKTLVKTIDMAGALKARVEFLENLVDTKPDITGDAKKMEELEKKISATELQLEQVRAAAADAEKKAAESDARAARLELELQKERKERTEEREKSKVMITSTELLRDQERATAAAVTNRMAVVSAARAADLGRELQKERKERKEQSGITNFMISSLEKQRHQERANAAAAEKKAEDSAARAAEFERQLMMESADKKEKVAELTMQLYEERRNAIEDRKRGHKDRLREYDIIEELTAKLQHYEQMSRQPVKQPQKLIPAAALTVARHEEVQSSVEPEVDAESDDDDDVVEIEPDLTNIFRLCRPDTEESFSLSLAVILVRDKLDKCGHEQWVKFTTGSVDKMTGCHVCEGKFPESRILFHFIDDVHVNAVSARKATVSTDALQYWLQQLDEAIAENENEDGGQGEMEA